MYGQKKISETQAKILRIIEQEIARTGRAPTYREIAEECGYNAVGTVQDHIRTLIEKGFLKKDPGIARGLKLAKENQPEPLRSIPILGTVPAGIPLEMIEAAGNVLGSISVSAQWKGELFALKVQGDSMIEAGIFEDDYVIVKRQSEAENGEIVVASIDGEATVKYLEKKNGVVKLLPANPRYSPIPIGSAKVSAEIVGKVISLQRFYSGNR
jgi:repressor LexA